MLHELSMSLTAEAHVRGSCVMYLDAPSWFGTAGLSAANPMLSNTILRFAWESNQGALECINVRMHSIPSVNPHGPMPSMYVCDYLHMQTAHTRAPFSQPNVCTPGHWAMALQRAQCRCMRFA
jgi:hypothetical protein